jgi:hypothetical protein
MSFNGDRKRKSRDDYVVEQPEVDERIGACAHQVAAASASNAG